MFERLKCLPIEAPTVMEEAEIATEEIRQVPEILGRGEEAGVEIYFSFCPFLSNPGHHFVHHHPLSYLQGDYRRLVASI